MRGTLVVWGHVDLAVNRAAIWWAHACALEGKLTMQSAGCVMLCGRNTRTACSTAQARAHECACTAYQT